MDRQLSNLAKVSSVSYKAKDADDSTATILEQNQYTIDKDAKTVTITAGIPTEGTYTVTITAEGYEDAAVEVTVAKKEESGANAPAVAEVKYVTGYNNVYRVSFKAMVENAGENGTLLNTYLNAIKEDGITFNDTVVTKKTSFSWPTPGSEWKLSSGSYGSEYIDFVEECFKDTSTGTIVIKAEGYKTLTFKIENGVLVEDGK